MKFLVIFGPPAVGKMSIGRVVAERTGLKLFHNHDTIELLLKYFEFGSDQYRRLTRLFRSAIFEEVSKSDLDGLIFTYVWAFDHPEDEQFLRDVCKIFQDVDAEIAFVELSASLEERLRRNRTPERLEAKASKRDLAKSEKNLLSLESEVVMNSDSSGIPLDFEYLRIETDELSKEETAEQIVKGISFLKQK